MRVLIGVDGSPHSRAALDWVKRLPWPEGTRVIVASAIRVPIMTSAEMYVPASTFDQLIEDERKAHQELVSEVEQELRDAGLTTRASVLHGDPREAIVQAAKDEGADLVVVGSHGRTGLAKLLMGSVASHIVAHAPCSVLVVKMERSGA